MATTEDLAGRPSAEIDGQLKGQFRHAARRVAQQYPFDRFHRMPPAPLNRCGFGELAVHLGSQRLGHLGRFAAAGLAFELLGEQAQVR